jgi:HEPN domain-containing protein
MATRRQLQDLALLRLQEAEALFAAGFYDGCAYLCGYVVELALKARICALLGVDEYPDNSLNDRLRRAFRTHDLNELKLLAGMQEEITPKNQPINQELYSNWSVATRWTTARRYEPKATYDGPSAQAMLEAITAKPDGVLECVSRLW